ncbi:putative signal transduction protein with Nacht domain protein [Gloeothece citriformis PCC 7424]|uniref:Putative signal transduction protein with Nacht domain protein n=1 Tax=Gloeothece citriformis (strain PCC 7424) TaxID=65393 RepID=B7KC92_GLOC7|nr:HEAT repeat domain-containing protein [Gloeothece citriformis]ACK70197.1 putative signal transduction protein with Nacht domain protein [Gloeothece citriformis PCC 7424]
MKEQPDKIAEKIAVFAQGGTVYIDKIIIDSQGKELSKKTIQLDWRLICQQVLQQQKNLRKRITERGFELNIYVPLGLVERKKQQRRKQQEDPNKDQVFELEETLITKEYHHNAFLIEIIGETGRENQRIAITGEPGAGKTTLLHKIATWIEEHQKGLPILIPLVALEKQTLEDYLLNNWLKKAEEFIQKEDRQDKTALKEALKERFREGGVWLLLDGLDEMAANSSGGVLTTIVQYLEGWITQARIILTSRLNVWDEQKTNPLSGFKTFRTLQFTDKQVTEFIEGWFAVAESSHTLKDVATQTKPADAGSQILAREGGLSPYSPRLQPAGILELQNKLKEPQYQSIQELIHNPLRLAMLCEVWYNNPGELPETKAQLYERYIRDYYNEWKSEQHQLSQDIDKQEELNKKLGELALQQLDSEVRFRIPRKTAYKLMGKELFNLACEVGWLNIVDREKETDEIVYAFYHPSFQEYFAATVIDDWDYFLPRKHKNKPVQGKKYRIFEDKWKEPFLLWLGRGDVEKNKKEALIEKLVTFKDGCGKWRNKGAYEYRAYCLAAMGVREFKQCSRTEEIVKQIVNWLCPSDLKSSSFLESYYFFYDYLSKAFFFKTIVLKKIMQATLLETERETAINALLALIQTSQSKETRRDAVETLAQIAPEIAPSKLIQTSQDEKTRRDAVETLAQIAPEIAPGNEKALDVLLALIQTSQDEKTHRDAAKSLAQIAPGNEKALDVLLVLIQTSKYDWIRRDAVETLGKIAPGNQKALDALVALIQPSEYDSTPHYAAQTLGIIARGNSKVIAALEALIQTAQDDSTRLKAAIILGKIAPGNQKAIDVLLALIQTSEYDWIRRDAAETLGKIARGNSKAIAALEALIQPSQSEWTRAYAAIILGKIAPDNEKTIDALVALIQTSQSEWIRGDAAKSLGEITPGNQKAIDALVALIQTTSQFNRTVFYGAKFLLEIAPRNKRTINELVALIQPPRFPSTLFYAEKSLGRIASGNQKAIAALEALIQTSQSDSTVFYAANILEEIAPGNEKTIDALVALIQPSQSEWTRAYAAIILVKIAPGHEKTIDALVTLIQTSQSDSTVFYTANILEEIAPGHEKTINALVALIQTSQSDEICRLAVETIGKIAPGHEKTIDALVALIQTSQSEWTRAYAAKSLVKIAPDNQKAINALVALIQTSQSEETRHYAARCLAQIAPDNQKAIDALEALISTSQDDRIRRYAALSLGKIAPGKQKAIDALVALISTSQDDWIRRDAARCLVQIAPDNQKAIAALETLIQTSQDEWTRRDAAECLVQIAFGNQKAIDALEYLIETSEDEETRLKAAQSLGKIAPGNEKAIAALVAILIKIETSLAHPYETGFDAAESLTQILTKSEMKKAITNLRKGIPTITRKIWLYFSFYPYIFLIFWHCAEKLPYPEFYQAWDDRRHHWFKPLMIILLSGSVAGTFIYTQSQTSPPPVPHFPQPEINLK